jgi:FMN phosphatase YigB (HAD superfamily)
MKMIKAVNFDADGVLITNGDFYSTPSELKDVS